MKAYYVELKVGVVVMAESEVDAMLTAERSEREIVNDSDLSAGHVEEIESLADLLNIDIEWTGACIPYGGDGNTPLRDLLPEHAPFVDTKTDDMFG